MPDVCAFSQGAGVNLEPHANYNFHPGACAGINIEPHATLTRMTCVTKRLRGDHGSKRCDT